MSSACYNMADFKEVMELIGKGKKIPPHLAPRSFVDLVSCRPISRIREDGDESSGPGRRC